MAKDEWMRAAMSDDMLVVELLVRLKRSQSTAASPLKSLSPPLTWTVRMPRSRALRCDASHRNRRHGCAAAGDSSTRCSPTTPLSWSAGAASPSATATVDGGFEEDSGISPSLPRSKRGIATNHEIASATTNKRSRKKKTFSELKEEECLLLKEKVQLKKDLTKLRSTYKERRTENESLKRMKVELGFHSTKQKACAFDSPVSTPAEKSKEESCEKGGFFLLPDLNSLPCDEDDYCSTTS